ncbi:MAG TPA: hypothetical protein VNA15_00125 [Candidatus Angelobacter sp.]|nr:hypothetical protein [Candidatus Angelobacter sp.]
MKAMEEIEDSACVLETGNQTVRPDPLTDGQLKSLLAELISSSANLNVRVWLDGVYTDIENAGAHGQWMKGREVYFKVEGRMDGQPSVGEPR